ncbi:MAG: PqqD family protein [Lachnospiraceae bacterium]|nr:PqqD family protein [Lachnospiraceae bacterium]
MKVREGFVLRKVADQYVVVAIGPASKILNGMIKLNETGAFCWDYLLKGISEDELGGVVCSEYNISREQAAADVSAFLDTLRSAGCLDED